MLLRNALPLLATVLALGGCGDDPVGSATAQSDLAFTRQDGTRVEFADQFYVWCGPWESDVAAPSVHVATRTVQNGRAWRLQAVRADVGAGAAVTFPNSFVWNQPRGVRLFVLDGNNELSTEETESTGSITFQEVSCERGGTVRFTVDAVVGSEYANTGNVRVTGSFEGKVGTPPS